MLTKTEKEIIVQCAKKYNVLSVILFGSSLEKNSKANDIDLAVKGIKPQLFFTFYSELFRRLPKPVDLVDLDEKSLFAKLIEKRGLKIYG